jgi:hypothetical protein
MRFDVFDACGGVIFILDIVTQLGIFHPFLLYFVAH